MKQIATPVVTIVLFFLSLFVYGKYGPGLPISSVVSQKQELFTMTGEGKVTVVPDTAVISVGINAEASSVADAQNQANTVINNVVAELGKLGIDKKDIKTSQYSIHPRYLNEIGRRNIINGYTISASLTVKVRELDKLNQAIDTATAQGANTVGGIQLTVDDEREKELLKEARKLAVEEAKQKAESLANIVGVTLGRIVNIQEQASIPPIYRNFAMSEARSADFAPTQIEPGSTDIVTSVTLFYEIR